MPELSVALWLVYLMIAFGLRVLVQLRTTGRTGLVSLRTLATPLERVAGASFVLALVGGFASALLPLLGWRTAWLAPWRVAEPLVWLGGGAYVVGVVSTFAAQLAMGSAWRIGVDVAERTELVADGLFAFVRNPIFTGLLLTAAGLALLCGSWLAWSSFALLVLALQLQVRGVEEPYLERTHGDAYRAYADRVGRFWPGVGFGV